MHFTHMQTSHILETLPCCWHQTREARSVMDQNSFQAGVRSERHRQQMAQLGKQFLDELPNRIGLWKALLLVLVPFLLPAGFIFGFHYLNGFSKSSSPRSQISSRDAREDHAPQAGTDPSSTRQRQRDASTARH